MADPSVATMTVSMSLNRNEVSVEVEPSEPLAYTLRERLGLTGTKVSCDVQACGACTVLVDGLPRSACTFLAYEARGREVADGRGPRAAKARSTRSSRRSSRRTASSAASARRGCSWPPTRWLSTGRTSDEDEIVEYMSGNLCRCTGYLPIVASILRALRGA